MASKGLSTGTLKANKALRYKAEVIYLGAKNTEIDEKSIKSIVIDHNIDVNHMPIIYITMHLDKKLVDKIVLNANKHLFSFSLYKYNDLKKSSSKKKCISGKFTYIIPDDINKNNDIDYNDNSSKTAYGNTFRDISIGLIRIDHVDANKLYTELNLSDSSAAAIARSITAKCSNLVIEPFNNNKKFKAINIPAVDSTSKSLNYLNDQSTFYSTPYRFYMDFNKSYLISSSGNAIKSTNDLCSSICIKVKNIIADEANDEGYVLDNDNASIYVSQASTQVYDNTISNKSVSKIRSISSTSVSTKSLKNKASYTKDKIANVRLNNDNTKMESNLIADVNNNGFYFFFYKFGLDLDLFTINKKITVEHVDNYKKFNGKYLVYRIREMLVREDESFALLTAVNLRKIGYTE
jgi:hypothetical protein